MRRAGRELDNPSAPRRMATTISENALEQRPGAVLAYNVNTYEREPPACPTERVLTP
jgi:hypothetical protein